MFTRLILTALTTAIFLNPCSGYADDKYVFAKLISEKKLSYPTGANNQGWEGWAYYSYTIGVDGRVQDVRVLDSNGIKTLNKALVKHVKSRVYEPASLNGQTVEEVIEVAKMTFLLTNLPRGANRKFSKRYKRARSAISNGELDEAEVLLQELKDVERRSLYEELYLQAAYAAYFTSKKNPDRAYAHTQRVLDFHDPREKKLKLVDEQFFVPFLVNAYKYEATSMMLGEALRSASLLRQISPESTSAISINAHAKQFTEGLEGKQHSMTRALTTPVYGGQKGVISVIMLKREFELESISGNFDSFTLYCKNGIKRLDYAAENAWIVPSSWGGCRLAAHGDVGATFTLTELPPGTLKKTQS